MKFSAALIAALSAITVSALPAALSARRDSIQYYTIHPGSDVNKCISVKGGKLVAGAAVDVYDCNNSRGQIWSWGPHHQNSSPTQLYVTVQGTGEQLCMDFPDDQNPDNLVNGQKILLSKCVRTGDDSIPGWQSWGRPDDATAYGAIEYSTYLDTYGPLCLDLTDGSTANGNVLQTWKCNPDYKKPYKNQKWTLSSYTVGIDWPN
jgi:hypothetical protein